MKGVDFVIGERGEKKAVIIDPKRHGARWEDFYDTALAKERENQPRETLQDVKKKVLGKG